MKAQTATKASGLYRWLVVASILIEVNHGVNAHHHLSRRAFPPAFIFGTASAAYQYEGAAREGGRGPSIWDTFSHAPGKIANGSNGDVAVDEYHRYKEDVALMKNMGMDAYRFSISWSRILPRGSLKGGINKEGVAYYNNLINELLKNGVHRDITSLRGFSIKPFTTLFHWDLPQALEDEYGGFLSPNIVRDFAAYAEVCFRAFGDRVKHWITLNEPWSFSSVGYDFGVFAPGRCSAYIGNCSSGNSATEPYIVGHNMLLAHAAAVDIYRRKYQALQNGSIGIAVVTLWILPYSDTVFDKRATERAMDFMFGWFMDPLATGDYPSIMRNLVGARLPKFSKLQSRLLKGSYDFIGLNYYTSQYGADNPNSPNPLQTDYTQDSRVNLTTERNGVPIGPKPASSWLYVYPRGLRDLLKYTKNRYHNPTIFITENGINEFNNDTLSLEQALNDTWRVYYYSEHLYYLREAIRHGSDVRGYFAWSLLDNFEWTSGYTVRFGLHYVDYKNNLKRYPKASANWFKKFLRG
eukprot:Gb_35939 [translate_table: standard]